MKSRNKDLVIIVIEISAFAISLATIWLDEFLDLPYRYLGSPPTPYRLAEYIIETGTISVVAVLVIVATVLIQKRARRFEEFVRVCGWCRKVWVNDHWVPFEKYMEIRHQLTSSHGICDDCLKEVLKKG